MKRILIIVAAILVAAALAWQFIEWRAQRLLEREFEKATGHALSVGRIGVNPFSRRFTFHDIRAEVGEGIHLNYLTLEKPRFGRRKGVRIRRITTSRRDTIAGFSFGGGRLEVVRASITNRDESVRFAVDSLRADTAAQTLRVAAILVDPTYSKEDFTTKSWNHGDWTRVQTGAMACSGLTIRSGTLGIDSMHITGGEIVSFKDRNTSNPTQVKPMYHTMIQRLGNRLKIGTVTFEGLSARYEELPAGGDKAGVLIVDNIAGRTLWGEEAVSWSAAGRMMGTAALVARGTLPLKGNGFEVTGSLGPCRASIFNAMTEPLGSIEVRDGRIEKLDFSIAGDSIRAHGKLLFIYDGLNVALLDKKDHDRKLLSAIVNNIVLNESNS